MKQVIYINGRFLTQRKTGVQRYAYETIKALDAYLAASRLQDKISCVMLSPRAQEVSLPPLTVIRYQQVGALRGHLWEQIELPLYSAGGVLLNLCNVAPVIRKNQLVIIHDAAVYAYPQAYTRLFRLWYKFVFNIVARRAKRILTVSHFSKEELAKYLKIPIERIAVVYPGTFISGTPKQKGEQPVPAPVPYVLAVSSLNPQKNFSGVVKAFESLKLNGVKLLLAGGTNTQVFKHAGIAPTSGIELLGYVTDEQLVDLYNKAICFVYPSFYEGFGLPPIEAMSCGCPVIVSQVASLPEVCGEAAIYCDPYRPETIAASIRQLFDGTTSNRDRLIELGHQRSRLFTFRKTAENIFMHAQSLLRTE